jgi:hypothetical protein
MCMCLPGKTTRVFQQTGEHLSNSATEAVFYKPRLPTNPTCKLVSFRSQHRITFLPQALCAFMHSMHSFEQGCAALHLRQHTSPHPVPGCAGCDHQWPVLHPNPYPCSLGSTAGSHHLHGNLQAGTAGTEYGATCAAQIWLSKAHWGEARHASRSQSRSAGRCCYCLQNSHMHTHISKAWSQAWRSRYDGPACQPLCDA